MSTPATEHAARAEERIRALHRSGDVDDLWPNVPAAQRRAAMKAIRTVVVDVLAGEERRPSLLTADAREARSIGVAAFASGMGPLLGYWVQQGLIDASDQVRRVLSEHLDHGTRRVAMLRDRTAALVRAMREGGVEPILMKGMHLGAEFYPHPSTRSASDIDFLVRPDDIAKVAATLRGMGFEETLRSSFGRRSTWAHASAPRVVRSIEVDVLDNPWTVDLHVALERWYFRGTRRDLGGDAFDTTRTIDIDGQTIRVLDQPHLVAFLGLHASYHLRNMQLIRLLELVWVMRLDRRFGRLDTGELESLLERTGTARFVYPAFALAEELAPGTVDARLLGRLATKVSPRMHRVLDKVRREELGLLNERSPDVLLAWAVGPRELALNALEILLPSDDAIGSAWSVLRRRLGILLHRSRRSVASGLGRGGQANVEQVRASGASVE